MRLFKKTVPLTPVMQPPVTEEAAQKDWDERMERDRRSRQKCARCGAVRASHLSIFGACQLFKEPVEGE